ncbi:hypothetical protein TSAR_002915 [Trichomalopsis sarcophagae]|uniref:Uncharacterized protein n=1 Tax=Trichomalopsis sarcophagae TaxID=543379 RepID=A0A232ERH5_9HYME|nr:hypothetical protein TSAR_002915 [Trichomalopsis sarcophagae]
MSDDQRTEELLGPTSCKTCTKVIAKRNPRKCDKCEWHYHARCTPTQPIFDNGKTIQVCHNCLLAYNLFSPGTMNSAPSTLNSQPADTTDTTILNEILEKLHKLDSIEKLQNTMKNEAEKNECRRLEPLDEIPRLMNRVTVVEVDVAVLRAEQIDIKAKLEQLLAKGTGHSTDSSSASALDLETVRQVRDSNTRIQAQLNRVASSQAKLSAELVITGLASTQATSLRLLAYAALKPLDAQLTERDITSARPLVKKRAVRENDAVSASTVVAVTEMRPTPIAVTVSGTLMRSLISEKN